MSTKRQIAGKEYKIEELVDSAIATADATELDLTTARESLKYLGNSNPSEELVTRFARETMILKVLGKETGAQFGGQIGKINFSTRENAIAGVQSYLNRRIAGQHARWSGRK